MNRSSNTKRNRLGVVLENPQGISLELSYKLDFLTSNNQLEYEACLTGIQVAIDIRASEIKICNDSQLLVPQVKGE